MPNVSEYEFDLIHKIAVRAREMAEARGAAVDQMTLMMDLESAHIDCPLKLDELLRAEPFDFSHDVSGIQAHMDRSTYPGKLTGCFLPRYAMT